MIVRFLVDSVIAKKLYFKGSIYALDDELAQSLLETEPPTACVLARKSVGGAPENKMNKFRYKTKERT